MMQRHMRLSASLDPVVQAIYTSIAGQASVTRIHKPIRFNNIDIDTKNSELKAWSEELYSEVDGKGLRQHQNSKMINKRGTDCSLKISGADFVHAIQVRSNVVQQLAKPTFCNVLFFTFFD